MAYVITRLCSDCVDTACVEACPVDCIYGLTADNPNYRRQLFIDPDECIDCGMCEPECPWTAIFPEDDVPEIFSEDTAINAGVFQEHSRDDFTIRPEPIRPGPGGDQIEENYRKWGFLP